jgi:hypothetical protein
MFDDTFQDLQDFGEDAMTQAANANGALADLTSRAWKTAGDVASEAGSLVKKYYPAGPVEFVRGLIAWLPYRSDHLWMDTPDGDKNFAPRVPDMGWGRAAVLDLVWAGGAAVDSPEGHNYVAQNFVALTRLPMSKLFDLFLDHFEEMFPQDSHGGKSRIDGRLVRGRVKLGTQVRLPFGQNVTVTELDTASEAPSFTVRTGLGDRYILLYDHVFMGTVKHQLYFAQEEGPFHKLCMLQTGSGKFVEKWYNDMIFGVMSAPLPPLTESVSIDHDILFQRLFNLWSADGMWRMLADNFAQVVRKAESGHPGDSVHD